MNKIFQVKELVELGILDSPMDGNHGEIHPVSKDFVKEGIPFVMSSDINDGIVDFNNCKFITKAHASKLRKGFSIYGDVLLTHKASIGRTAINNYKNEEYIMLTPQVTYYRVLDKTKLNNEFLKQYFNSHYFQQTIQSWAQVGSTRAYIGITKQLELPIYLPDISTQQKIASILSALDDKIELNNIINTELELMAKTLYDYWFIQFDFPNEEGKPYKSSGGKMVYNEVLKREIPKGWDIKKVKNIAKTGSGGTPKSTENSYYENGKIPWINSGELNNSFIVHTKNFITELGMNSSSTKLFPSNTILMAMYGATAGKTSIISFEATTNQAICAVMPFDKYLFHYTKFVLDDMYQYLINLSTGSARDNLSQEKIKELDIIIPEQKIIKVYSKIVSPFFDKIKNNLLQNQELASLRDWLLPMLMNGQVKVTD